MFSYVTSKNTKGSKPFQVVPTHYNLMTLKTLMLIQNNQTLNDEVVIAKKTFYNKQCEN